MVRHGVTGLLVPPYDVAALRAAIVHLMQDVEGRAELSANCRRIAVRCQRYSDEQSSRRGPFPEAFFRFDTP
jgi:glycosyltransferase involved in cell wall biosynthesis